MKESGPEQRARRDEVSRDSVDSALWGDAPRPCPSLASQPEFLCSPRE